MMTPRCTALLLLSTLVTGCGDAADRPDHYALTDVGAVNSDTPRPVAKSAPEGDDVATGSCDMASTRDCRVWLPEVNGTKNCFVGSQICADGRWSACLSDEEASGLLAGD